MEFMEFQFRKLQLAKAVWETSCSVSVQGLEILKRQDFLNVQTQFCQTIIKFVLKSLRFQVKQLY